MFWFVVVGPPVTGDPMFLLSDVMVISKVIGSSEV